jgi:hypothetical protein
MRKLTLIIGAVCLTAAAPAYAKWWMPTKFFTSNSCSTDKNQTNFFSLIGC